MEIDKEELTEDRIVLSVMKKLNQRSLKGIETYGVSLEREDYDIKDWLQELQQELLDGANYIEAILQELEQDNDD